MKSFEVEVSHNLFWVSSDKLGDAELSNQDILQMIMASPEEKQKRINTLSDAINLFRQSDFCESSDNIHYSYQGLLWEFSRPGREAILCNTGNCASDTSWLAYLLGNNFEDFGAIGFIRPNGSGHVINYFFRNETYYIIDLMTYEKGYPSNFKEDGNIVTFNRRRYFTAGIIKCRNLSDYIRMFQRYLRLSDLDFLFYTYSFKGQENPSIFPVGKSEKINEYIFPLTEKIQVWKSDNFRILYDVSPNIYIDWVKRKVINL